MSAPTYTLRIRRAEYSGGYLAMLHAPDGHQCSSSIRMSLWGARHWARREARRQERINKVYEVKP